MSVINQMLRDLDRQQGKISPAVVPQKPSFPRPAAAKNRKFLFIGLALAAVGLWFATTAPFDLPAIFASAKTPVVAAKPIETAVPEATAPETAALKTTATTVKAEKAVATDTQDAEHQTTVAKAAKTSAELQGNTATETTAVVAETIPTAAVLPVVTDSSDSADSTFSTEDTLSPDSNSYPATKPSEFVADTSAETSAARAPSSMQVEAVVFDAKLQLQRLAEQAGEALHQGQWQRLQQQAQHYIQLAPAEVQGYEWLAESYRQLQQWPALQQLLQLCQQLNLRSDLLGLQQGRLASQLKNWPAAEQALQQISPSFAAVEVLQLKANALQQQQKLAEALVAWQQLTTLQPGVGRGWLGQALVLEQQGQKQQANQAYQQALTAGGLSAATVQFIQQRLAIAE